MKRSSIRLIVVTIATAVALASCAKEIRRENKSGSSAVSEGSRTIAVSFAPQTKTALRKDGLTPEFQPGDSIMVVLKDGTSQPEVCIVTRDTVINTNLKGDLVAVYPSSAAKLNGNTFDGVCVSPKQTGKFADANICTAFIPAGSKTANFNNETAILKFYVDKSINVNSITIIGKENVADGSSSITVDGSDENSILFKIAKGLSNERICYVAVLAGTHTALNFTSVTSTQDAPVQKQLQVQTTLAAGTMYNVFLPYYIQVGDQKWGYCNLGAFLPEETGYYFTWGNTYGYVPKNYEEDEDDVEWFLPSGEPAPAGGFTNDNYSKTKGSTLTSNLTAENDAATAAWGGNWRMPTQSEFEALCGLQPEWKAYHNGTQYGRLVGNLFFPAVGRGYNENLEYLNEKSYYWSSTINDNTQASYFNFASSRVEVSSQYSRSQGFAIRPIYGTPAPAIPSGALPGEFTVAVDNTGQNLPPTKVHFSKGNLQATYKGTDYVWGFAEHQYDYIAETSGNMSMNSPKNGDVVDLFGWVGKSSSFTGAAVYGISDNDKSEDYSNDVNDVLKSDWGNTIDDKGTWRTLSKDEWNYLLHLREMKNGGARYHDFSGGITLKDKNENEVTGYGLVLYPDGFADQDSWVNAYKTWDEFAQNGLVFLPAAGRRNGNNIEYYGHNEHCYYWTSTHESTKPSRAYYLWVYSSSNPEFTDIWCNAGNAVRLVTNCATNK